MEEFDMSDMILEKRKKEKDPIYKRPQFIIGSLVFILIVVSLIAFVAIKSSRKENSDTHPQDKEKKTNYIYNNAEKYLKQLTKFAISEKRVKNLFIKKENEKGDYYDDIIVLEKNWFKVSWNQFGSLEKKNDLFKEIDEYIYKLIPSIPIKENGSFIQKLFNVTISEQDIDIYKDDKNINYINNQLKEGKLVIEMNAIILFTFINLPLQASYFSKESSYKIDFISKIREEMKLSPAKEIFSNINQNQTKVPSNVAYMVLGAAQGEERKRIEALNPYGRIVNVGIRTQSTETEVNNFLSDNIDYYTKEELRPLMEKSRISGEMSDEEYTEFVKECKELKNNITVENAFDVYNRYNFSVETANTVIEYLKMNVSLDKINIIRLGTNDESNKEIRYDPEKVYILYNVIDIEQSRYKYNGNEYIIYRATTVANVKTLIYLRKECPNFLPDKETEWVLISSKYYAERQLEAFNIIYNIFNYGLELHYVIWNKINDETPYDDSTLVDIMLDTGVKSFNIIFNNINQKNEQEYEKTKDQKIKNIIDYYNYILTITDNAKNRKY